MRIVIDIEANGLVNPDKIWVIVCKDIDTGKISVFRQENLTSFIEFSSNVELWIGHNIIAYDLPVLKKLLNFEIEIDKILDTLIISKLVDYSRASGHSVECYGEEFGMLKGFTVEDGSVLESKYFPASFFLQYSKDLENYCIRDVEITHKIYTKYTKYISNIEHSSSISLEQHFQLVCNNLEDNGFSFNITKATKLLSNVEGELRTLDVSILDTFKPKLKYIRTVTPKETKYGTISLTSIPKELRNSLDQFTVGAPFSYCRWVNFNPSSHSQIIRVLNEAAWSPVDKTKTHLDTERAVNSLKYRKKDGLTLLTLEDYQSKLKLLQRTGWKVNENNLETLPPSAPAPARLLARRILLESRRRTLTEWLELVKEGRIHGRFYGLGAWTHRMSHQKPNTANIPNELDTAGKKKLLGKEMRSLWRAPNNRLLVGVDAEGIQLRIFAHYINDPEFTKALVEGRKDDKTDPHSLNQRILGSVCKSRAAAKRFIYALLLGAGRGKLSEILQCSQSEADEALARLLERYSGWAQLKDEVFPKDAKRGWFTGLDGRKVAIPGDTVSGRRHLAMSGYLQNGEAVVMKSATLKWWHKLEDYDALLVNFVHDEWQVECPNNLSIALDIAAMMASSLQSVGQELGLKCPLAGSYWNDDLKDYTIDTNWSKTH